MLPREKVTRRELEGALQRLGPDPPTEEEGSGDESSTMALRETLAKSQDPRYSDNRTCESHRTGIRCLIFPHPLQCRPIFDAVGFPTEDLLMDRIRGLNHDRIRLDGLLLLLSPSLEQVKKRLSVEEVKKVLRASQMAAVWARLRAILMHIVFGDLVFLSPD
ncbi:hypothetical protein J5N97_017083 [Dioscorea zingiberensis]|uniref:Uncharacterized protein n=1 Tax=Dioscorea zingiberensis TaxID=325984 RepID=A0A9D5CKL8_9LILI|nr:hypothetical protein J5N97_017083 [Dioscorea zingiberensis]